MKELIVKGKASQLNGFDWEFVTSEKNYSSDILVGIDELLVSNNIVVIDNNEEIEVVIRFKNRL
jgi:hypothetical protein